MDAKVKEALQEGGEEITKVALEQSLKIAEAYAASTESSIDDGVVSAIKMLHDAFLKDLADKINPAD
jgi:hypothetical protein